LLGTWYSFSLYDQNGALLSPPGVFYQFTQPDGSTVDLGTMLAVSTSGGAVFYPSPLTSSAQVDLEKVPPSENYVLYPHMLGPLPIVANGNFESGAESGVPSTTLPPAGWLNDPSVTLSYETSSQYKGIESLKAVYDGSNPNGTDIIQNNWFPVNPGDTFYIEGAVKTDGTLTGSAEVIFVNFTDNTSSRVTASSSSSSWTKVSAVGTVPAGYTMGIVHVYASPFTTPGTVWYDAIACYKVNFPGPLTIQGATPTGSGTDLSFGTTAGIGNAAAANLQAPAKGTGTGPTTLTAVKWMEEDVGGTKFWRPLFQ